VNSRTERLAALCEERSAPDDIAVSAFEEGERVVVLRLRREGCLVLIVDDGKGPVFVDDVNSLIARFILPRRPEDEAPGYAQARERILRVVEMIQFQE